MIVNLVLLREDRTTKRFTLPDTVTTIGRQQDCNFCLPLSVVSRKHCEVNLDGEKIVVRDHDSRNGTFLNGQRIKESVAKGGDLFQIGPVKFVIQVDGNPDFFDNYLPESEDHSTIKNGPKNCLDASDEGYMRNSETAEILEDESE
jgi:pSer/pThr/pTyr-binding forkhead associated (FHA) protein